MLTVLAALIGAAATIVVVWITQRMNRTADTERSERERSLRQGEWQRDRRAETYQAFVTFLSGERLRIETLTVADHKTMTDDDWRSMHGQIEVFASRHVRGLVDAILTQRFRFASALWQLREHQSPDDTPSEDVSGESAIAWADLESARYALRGLIEETTEAIRSEMGSNDR